MAISIMVFAFPMWMIIYTIPCAVWFRQIWGNRHFMFWSQFAGLSKYSDSQVVQPYNPVIWLADWFCMWRVVVYHESSHFYENICFCVQFQDITWQDEHSAPFSWETKVCMTVPMLYSTIHNITLNWCSYSTHFIFGQHTISSLFTEPVGLQPDNRWICAEHLLFNS